MTPADRKPGRASATPAGTRDSQALESRLAEDRLLIESVLDGSVPHWHVFVDRYSGLIYSVIRRQLFAEDVDEIRNVFTEVLDDLFRGKLAEFEGRSELSTWLIVVSRGKSLDYLRRRDGRRKLPLAHDQLTPLEQQVFRLHHVEGLAFEATIHTLESQGQRVTADDIANAVARIESLMDRHYLRRLEYESRAPAMGVSSGRALRFMNEMQIRYDAGDHEDAAASPEALEEMGQRVRALLAEMSGPDQELMRLRFEEGWTARRIADSLTLDGGQRRVYTTIDRIIRELRNKLGM